MKHDAQSDSLVEPRTLGTEQLRRQHTELFELGQALRAKLDPETVSLDSAEVRRMLARFVGRVRVHAAMEHAALYPRLLAHDDPAVRSVAQRLLDEVGPIYALVAAVGERYPTTESVQADPRGFVQESRRVLRVLGERVMRETSELYPLAEAALAGR